MQVAHRGGGYVVEVEWVYGAKPQLLAASAGGEVGVSVKLGGSASSGVEVQQGSEHDLWYSQAWTLGGQNSEF